MSDEKVWERKSSWLILLGALCVVLLIMTSIIVLNVRNQNNIEQTQETKEEPIDELYEKEKEETSKQPTAEEYIAEVDRRISETMSAESKAELYIDRAEELYSRHNVGEGDFEKQILDAKERVKIEQEF